MSISLSNFLWYINIFIVVVKDNSEPVIHVLTSQLQIFSIRLCGSVKVSAVRAASTSRDFTTLVDPRAVFQLRNPLPGVLAAVCEEDVRRSDLVASVHVLSTFHIRVGSHI